MWMGRERGIDSFLETLKSTVREWGERPAVYNRGELVFTYRELFEVARGVGLELVEAGLQPGELVALGMEKSPAYLAGLLGVWCAEGAFLPLRPSLPAGRRERIQEDARPRAILKRGCSLKVPVVEIYKGEGHREEGLAYVIYTSGSSGHPRGVALGHGGIRPFVEAQVEAFRLKPESRVLWYLSADFDASLSDILTAFVAGASIFIEDPEELRDPGALMGLLRKRRITHVDLPPSLLSALDPERVGPSLETLIIGGEVCPLPEVRRWSKRLRLVSCYGPTETTVCTSVVICDPDWAKPLLGEPFSGVRYEVRCEDGSQGCAGDVGELLISGGCVARGYLNCPDETAARFQATKSERTFRTGDLVRVHEGGALEFVGRRDRQVKVGGKWVNLEALEVILAAAPGIARAAIVPRMNKGSAGLVAFYEVRGEELLWPRELPPVLRVEVEGLPLTASGKVDLPALMTWPLFERSEGSQESDDFATPLEAAIASLYGAVLERGTPNRDEDFFSLGGDSLRALHLIALSARHGITITTEMLARDGRVRSVAKRVTAGVGGEEPRRGSVLAEEAEVLARTLAEAAPGPSVPRPWKRVFLTGATGALGGRVLHELLEQTQAEIVCLVRGSSEEAARARLGRWSKRIKVIHGDLMLPFMGLSEQGWKTISAVDAIVHVAAAVNLSASYDELEGPNLQGTLEVLRLLRTGPAKELHYVSTLSVAVASDRSVGVVRPEPLDPEVHVWGGYAQSKWAAEWLVQSAAPEARIYRPGLLVGGNTSGSSAEMLHYFWRGTARLGCVPEEYMDGLEVDITPIGWAARTLVERALTGDPGTIVHLASPRAMTLRLLVDCLRAYGVEVEALPTNEWRRRLFERLDRELAGYMLAMCRCLGDDAYYRWRPFDLFQATGYDLGAFSF